MRNRKRSKREMSSTSSLKQSRKPSQQSSSDISQGHEGKLRWLTVIGTFWTMFIFAAASKSFGVIYVSLRKEFHASDLDVSWVGAINLVVWGLTGPISAYLCEKFGYRCVGVAGAIVTISSFALSAMVTTLEWLYLSYGFCLGVGLSLVYTPGLLVVNRSFTEGKMLAVAIASSGLPIGTLILPPLLSYLTSAFGYRWCFLFLATLSLLLIANGILYRLPGEAIMGESMCLNCKPCQKEENFDNLQSTYIPGDDFDFSLSRHYTSNEDLKLSCHDYSESQSLLGYIEESEMTICHKAMKYLKMLGDIAVVTFLINSFNQQMINSFLSENMVAFGLEIGFSRLQGALLLSMEGLGSLVGPILISLVMDYDPVQSFRADVVNVCLLLGGFMVAMTPIVTSYTGQMTSAVLRGCFVGVMSVHGVTMAQIVIGLDKTPKLFGLALAIDALASLVGRTVGGIFTAYLGTYTGAFILIGCLTLVGCSCFQLFLLFRRHKGYNFSGNIPFGKSYFR